MTLFSLYVGKLTFIFQNVMEESYPSDETKVILANRSEHTGHRATLLHMLTQEAADS